MERGYEEKVTGTAAEAIKKLMENEGVPNQYQYAKMLGASRQSVNKRLNHGKGDMRFSSFKDMAEVLGYEIFLRKM